MVENKVGFSKDGLLVTSILLISPSFIRYRYPHYLPTFSQQVLKVADNRGKLYICQVLSWRRCCTFWWRPLTRDLSPAFRAAGTHLYRSWKRVSSSSNFSIISLSPRFSKKKRGLCNTVRRPSVRPSVYLSIGLYLLLGY